MPLIFCIELIKFLHTCHTRDSKIESSHKNIVLKGIRSEK